MLAGDPGCAQGWRSLPDPPVDHTPWNYPPTRCVYLCMNVRFSGTVAASALLLPLLALSAGAQDSKTPATPANTLSVQANLVVVPAIVYDKHALVTTLTKNDFALAVNGKPQTIRYFDRETDLPLTVGLLVDVSHSMAGEFDEEQKASQSFLDAMLKPAAGSRPADRAFILQFAHTAELLQDVTASRPLLAAGLKQIGSQAPGAADDEADTKDDTTNTSTTNNGSNGRGGYGRNGRNGGNPSGDTPSHSRGGTVLYDALFLSSDDVLGKQTSRRALVVLTDGIDRHSKESLTETIEAAQRADVVVYAIYLKGETHREFAPTQRRGGYGGYGGYPGGGNYPGSGGRPGSDGTYAEPDGKKILQRICGETGGQMFEVKGKGAVEKIYAQIGDELRAQYRLGFTPTEDAATVGYHKIDLTLTATGAKKDEVQTREGYYTGPKPSR